MSTRRAVRPDAMVYRQTRRLGKKKRNFVLPAILVAAILLLALLVVLWIRHRH